MENIRSYCNYITDFKRINNVSIDMCHNILIFGLVVSSKPERVLELGIGRGYVTNSIMSALKYNKIGMLEAVDNLHDWGKDTAKDAADILNNLKALGVMLHVPVSEFDFVSKAESDTYDFIVSDADHSHSGEWTDHIWRIAKPDAIIVVHDIFSYTSPYKYVSEAKRLGKPTMIFNKSSRKDEECNNGLAIIANRKD